MRTIPYDLKEEKDLQLFQFAVQRHIEQGHIVELNKKVYNRTLLQNKALHLYFKMIAEALNNAGLYHKPSILKIAGLECETEWTHISIKENFWRPFQIVLFRIESTKDINTQQMNQIIDQITAILGRKGIRVDFPSKEMKKLRELEEAGIINK